MAAFRATVKGMVQGVGFRYYTQRAANRLGVRGWVRNLPDGNVEVEVEADRDTLERFIEELEAGPTFARVDEIDLHWLDADPGHRSFSIKY